MLSLTNLVVSLGLRALLVHRENVCLASARTSTCSAQSEIVTQNCDSIVMGHDPVYDIVQCTRTPAYRDVMSRRREALPGIAMQAGVNERDLCSRRDPAYADV